MRRFLEIHWLAAATWLAWGVLAGLLLAMVLLRWWHPHFLPVCLAVALLAACAGLLVLRGTVAIARGPRRWRKLGVVLIGLAPLWFATAHGMYGFKAGHSRQVRLDLLQKWLIPLGESLIDLESRFRYPQRTVGEKVVMISEPVDDAAEQVATMDAHVRTLEKRLGREIQGQIHWFRGPLLGMRGRAIFGVCMGSRIGEANPDATGLDALDRHEVAHCVINQFCTIASEPPALFAEGWAEANMGHDELKTAYNCWQYRDQTGAYSLAELTGPEWVGRHEWPVYVQGAALVNYVLREYGAKRFLQLYTTGRRKHFDKDCRRILGIELAELDAAYWADVERQATEGKPYPHVRLESIPVAPEIDAEDWRRFLTEYFAAVPRLLSGYDSVRLDLELITTAAADRNEVRDSLVEMTLVRDGDCRFAYRKHVLGESATIASPTKSRSFHRSKPGELWKVEAPTDLSLERYYRRNRLVCDRFLELEESMTPLAADRMLGLDPANTTVTRFERVEKNEMRLVHVGLRWGPRSPRERFALRQDAALTLNASEGFRLESFRYEAPAHISEGIQEYDQINGAPVIRRRVTKLSDQKGARWTTELRTKSRQVERRSPEEFTPELLLDGSFESTVPVAQALYLPPPLIWDWYWVVALLGALSLALGCGILLQRSHRT